MELALKISAVILLANNNDNSYKHRRCICAVIFRNDEILTTSISWESLLSALLDVDLVLLLFKEFWGIKNISSGGRSHTTLSFISYLGKAWKLHSSIWIYTKQGAASATLYFSFKYCVIAWRNLYYSNLSVYENLNGYISLWPFQMILANLMQHFLFSVQFSLYLSLSMRGMWYSLSKHCLPVLHWAGCLYVKNRCLAA